MRKEEFDNKVRVFYGAENENSFVIDKDEFIDFIKREDASHESIDEFHGKTSQKKFIMTIKKDLHLTRDIVVIADSENDATDIADEICFRLEGDLDANDIDGSSDWELEYWEEISFDEEYNCDTYDSNGNLVEN